MRTAPVLTRGRGGRVMRNGQPRPEHYAARYPRQLVNAGTSTTGWALLSGGAIALATVTTPEGLAMSLLRFLGSGDNTTGFFQCVSAPFVGNQAGKDGIEFDLYYAPGEPISDLGNSGVDFRATFIDAGGTNSVNCNIQIRQGWQRIRMKKADFNSIGGTGNWDTTPFNRLLFRVGARAGVTHTVFIRNLGYMGQSKTKICVQFDDIGISVYNIAFPLMRERNIVGSCAVIGDAIGQSAFAGYDRMSAAQMREMKAAGWDFVNHTKTHGVSPFLTAASQATCLAEITGGRDAIIANGLGNGISEHLFCAPYGEFSTNYWAAAAEAGVKLFRGTVGDNTGNTPRIAESDVIYSPTVQVPTLYVTRTQTPATLLDDVDSCIGKGGYLIPLFHHILTTPGTDIEYSTANLTTFLDGLVSRAANLEFVNMSQLYEATRL